MIKKWTDSSGGLHEGKIWGAKEGFKVIACVNCGFKHVVPIPTEEFLSNYYKEEYIKKRVNRKNYPNFYKKMEGDVPWLEVFYNEKYDLFEKYLDKNNRSIVDIGSGLGLFLSTGKKRGWQTKGVEPSKESCVYSKGLGLDVSNIYLNEHNYRKIGKYDVVHMNEVLEHLPDPNKMMQVVKDLLNPNGLICIVSPNDFNPLQVAYVESSKSVEWWISPPEHINYFNHDSASALLEKHGFNIVEQTSTFPLEMFLLMGDKYVGNNILGTEIHLKRSNFELTLFEAGKDLLRRDLYRKFAKLGIGREFCIIGKSEV